MQLAELVAEANIRFAGMTREQKRVTVAKDAIWQVSHNHIRPYILNYFKSTESACVGCAYGCLLAGLSNHTPISRVKYNADVAHTDSQEDTAEALSDIFTRNELSDMENAFCLFATDNDDVAAWSDKHQKSSDQTISSDRNRFMWLAANIIHNNGTFTPTNDPPESVYLEIIRSATATPVTPTIPTDH